MWGDILLTDFSETIRKYRTEFEAQRVVSGQRIHDLGCNLYIALCQQYDFYETLPEQKLKKQIYLCKFTVSIILPKVLGAIKACKNLALSGDLLSLYEKYLALAARRDLESFLLYMGVKNNVDLWSKTVPITAGLIYYSEQMFHFRKIQRILLSQPPSTTKSYFLNNYSAWRYGQDINDSILRLSYSDKLVRGASKNVKEILKSPAFADVFPAFEKIEFATDKEEEWKIKGAAVPASFNAVTRDGAITGLRAYLAVLDDMTKGVQEAMSIDVHEGLWMKYWNEIHNRRMGGQQIQAIIAGTMWSLNDIINRLRMGVEFVPTKYPYTDISEDGRIVSIAIPALDENDESVFAHVYGTEELHEIRNNNTEYFFQAVYQQNCIAEEGMEFTYANLQTYNELPDGERGGRYAALDPARKGKNYVSMPVVEKIDGEYYLIDFLYKKKAMSDLYDLIADKIILNKVQDFVIENNTDTSLKKVIVDKLAEKGYTGCSIREKYATENKEDRIKDNQGYVRSSIIFPEKGLYSESTDMGKAIRDLTVYSFDYPNKYDDSIDSVCLLTAEYIYNTRRTPKAKIVQNILRV